MGAAALGDNPPSTLLSGLLAWFGLHEASGNSRADSTGAAPSLAETGGTVSSTAGLVGDAASLAGSANYLRTNWTPPSAGAYTISALVNPASLTDSSIVVALATGASSARVSLAYQSNGSATFAVSGGSVASNPSLVGAGTWSNLVGVWDGVVSSLYINGILRAQQTKGGTDLNVNGKIAVGSNVGVTAAAVTAGLVQGVGIWGRALTDGGAAVGGTAGGEIALLYRNGLGRDYRFN